MEKIELFPGNIVKSLKGHDTGKVYLVTAVANSDFVLIADGKNRTVETPKLKRAKHLKLLSAGAAKEISADADIKNSGIINILRKFEGGFYA